MSYKLKRILVPVVSFVTLLALACTCGGLGGTTPTQEPPPTDEPLPTDAPPPTKPPIVAPTEIPALPTDTPVPEPEAFTGGFDDFTEDTGAWTTIPDRAGIANGVFYLGPFDECSDIDDSTPFGCFTLCIACGYVSEYDMKVDVAYVDGVSSRLFGLILRFIDNDGDGFAHEGDYLLYFGLSVYDQFFRIWERNTDGKWYLVAESFEGSIRGGSKINTLRAVSYDSGSAMDLYINDTKVNTVTDIPYDSGAVGFVLDGRAVTIGFDDFEISVP
ncbi:MAG: hypothetical protein HYZ49_15340 [Chloroflexi bacterium]|nr:hypothetical protein [Chloroflexota bacterium]